MRQLQFEPAHMDVIEMRDVERDFPGKDYLTRIMTVAGPMGWTFVHDGRILGMSGLIAQHPGVVNGYIIPSIYAARYMFHFHRAITRQLDAWERGGLYHRVQTISRDDPQTNRWMEILGFTCEGLLLQFSTAKETYRHWARFNKWAP